MSRASRGAGREPPDLTYSAEMPGPQPPKFDDHLARRLAGRFRLLSFLWIVLSVLLLASAVGAVAAA